MICDVFDGARYQALCGKRVVVDGVQLCHHYFEEDNDFALDLTVDGYLLFKWWRGGPTATPIILQNLNLPPQY